MDLSQITIVIAIVWGAEPDSNHGPATASFWRFDRFFRLAPFLPPDMYFHPTFGVQIVSTIWTQYIHPFLFGKKAPAKEISS